MTAKKKVLSLVAAVLVIAVLGCIWWFVSVRKGPVDMNAKDLEQYWPYALVDGGAADFDVLAHCAPTEYDEDAKAQLYASRDLESFLYHCGSLTEIAVFDRDKDTVSINYESTDGMKIYLILSTDGTPVNAAVYEPQHDVCYVIDSPTEGYKYPRFRNSSGEFSPPER